VDEPPRSRLHDGVPARIAAAPSSAPPHRVPVFSANPDEAVRLQAERDARYPNGWDIPVYESDGTTEIGTFYIGVGVADSRGLVGVGTD